MFFELHEENAIGFKCLTPADLGCKPTSNNTHIGLLKNILTFMPDKDHIANAVMIYDETVLRLPCFFDRIQNPDDSYRSPKIRKGTRKKESVVSFVRKTAKNVDPNGTWYLVWFGLKSEEPVFLLFEKKSKTYRDLLRIGIDLDSKSHACFTIISPFWIPLLHYLERVVNLSNIDYAEELELAVQYEQRPPKRTCRYNIERAQEMFRKIGRAGEKAIDQYLLAQKEAGHIEDYAWANQHFESGSPYDFYVTEPGGKTIYIDVKTTGYRFEQRMVFSCHEAAFAAAKGSCYRIYRVYQDIEGAKYLKICSNAAGLLRTISNKTATYKEELSRLAQIQNIKIEIEPNNGFFVYSEAIRLI